MPEVTQDLIGNMVVGELYRRLSDPEEARDLPATGLLTMANNHLKLKQEEAALERARLEEKKLDPLEMIDQPGLSRERRIEILTEYVTDLEDVWRRASQILEELLNGDTGSLPEVQNVVS